MKSKKQNSSPQRDVESALEHSNGLNTKRATNQSSSPSKKKQNPLLAGDDIVDYHPPTTDNKSNFIIERISTTDDDYDDDNNNKHASATKMSSCFKSKCVLFSLMAIILTTLAIIVAILKLLDKEDLCFHESPFHQPAYKLYATKTTYQNAADQLDSIKRNSPADLPSFFSQDYTLKSLDERLTSSQCVPKQFHYIGRHAARYPSGDSIKKINAAIAGIQQRIDLSKFSPFKSVKTSSLATTATPIAEARTSDNPGPVDVGQKNESIICYNPLAPYKQWMSIFSESDGNQITSLGFEETLQLAQKFKSIYPDMFDWNKASIEFNVTKAPRTAQTAMAFIKSIDNRPEDVCSEISNDKSYYENTPCIEKLTKSSYSTRLDFHKTCEAIAEKAKVKKEVELIPDVHLKSENRTRFIAQSLSKKLRLSKDEFLNSDEVDAIHDVCKYETAVNGSSIWCNLFEDDELKFIEYLKDIEDYYEKAYGDTNLFKSSCAFTSELATDIFYMARESGKPSARFYFTHSQALQKILASGLAKDEAYEEEVMIRNLDSGTVPSHRDWRTSLMTPFSANIAFTVYECPNKDLEYTNLGYPDIHPKIQRTKDKVVVSVNEIPISVKQCPGFVCDLEILKSKTDILGGGSCSLPEMCKTKYVIKK